MQLADLPQASSAQVPLDPVQASTETAFTAIKPCFTADNNAGNYSHDSSVGILSEVLGETGPTTVRRSVQLRAKIPGFDSTLPVRRDPVGSSCT